MTDQVYLWEILIPTIRRVNSKPYETRYHRVWDSKVLGITDNLTILQPSKGQWVSSNGELSVIRMIPVRIAANRDQIDKIIDMSLVYYDQLAIFCVMISSEVIIKYKE